MYDHRSFDFLDSQNYFRSLNIITKWHLDYQVIVSIVLRLRPQFLNQFQNCLWNWHETFITKLIVRFFTGKNPQNFRLQSAVGIYQVIVSIVLQLRPQFSKLLLKFTFITKLILCLFTRKNPQNFGHVRVSVYGFNSSAIKTPV